MSRIKNLHAREIIDSRGNPTLEVEVFTENGYWGRSAVPSGASTGEHEACELRDNDANRYMGRGVLKAIENINHKITPEIVGLDICDQKNIDQHLIKLDGTDNKKNLGANATLGVSLAVAKAASALCGLPLYRYLGGLSAQRLPVPFMNILNGGAHADNKLDIQEFMIVPSGFNNFTEALQCGIEIYHNLKKLLKEKNLSTTVGDEGGFAPSLSSNEQALELISEASIRSNYKLGKDVNLALDVAASELFHNNFYHLKSENKKLSQDEMIEYISSLVENYPIVSVEDPMDENDWQGFSKLTTKLGHKAQIIGDDLFVTNTQRLQKGIEEKAANSILIKLNQIGTLTETLNCIELARNNGFRSMISHRSGETEDTFIADLSVACGCGQIKTGAPSRSERTSKYNQLLRISEELGEKALYTH